MSSLDVLLFEARSRTGLEFPVELRTNEYLTDDNNTYEWVHRLVYVDGDRKPHYTTGIKLQDRGDAK